LTKVAVVFVAFGLVFFGGWTVSERPKLALALGAMGVAGWWPIIGSDPLACAVHVNHERGEADRQRYSSDNRKV
jgi:hypothetical protein